MSRGRPSKTYSVERQWLVEVSARGRTQFTTVAKTKTALNAAIAKAREVCGEEPRVQPCYFEVRTRVLCIDPEGRVKYIPKSFSAATVAEAEDRADLERFGVIEQALTHKFPFSAAELDADSKRLYRRALKVINQRDEILNRQEQITAETLDAPTIGELIERNLHLKESTGSVEESTLEPQDSYFRNWIKNPIMDMEADYVLRSPYALADLLVSVLTQDLLQHFVEKLSITPHKHGKAGLSRKTIENVLSVVSSAWGLLKRDPKLKQLYDRISFSENLTLPKARVVRPNNRWSFEDIESLIASCEGKTESAIVGLGMCAIRAPGEIAGAGVADVFDYKGHKFLHVHQQIDMVKKIRVLKSYTKTGLEGTEEGERKILILPRIWKLIEPAWQEAKAKGSNFIVMGEGGTGTLLHSAHPRDIQNQFSKISGRAGTNKQGQTQYALRKTVTSHAKEVAGSDLAFILGGWKRHDVFSTNYDEAQMLDFQIEHMPKMKWAVEPT